MSIAPRVPDAARELLAEVDGIQCRYNGKEWEALHPGTAYLLLSDWKTYERREVSLALYETIRKGHIVTSPVCPKLEYRSAGASGRQQPLELVSRDTTESKDED